ncbi:MAG: gamma-glutamyltransferase [Rickettsiales bacterium]|nr:gamma-glutamyltransferase [Rickettsiales bacterium]
MFTTRPELVGTFGVVTTTHWLGSAVGMSVLEKGGNAFDAAVSTGFTLQIVEPHLNGPGGDMPAIFQAVGDPTPRALCGQGPIPKAATIEHFKGLGLELIPGSGLLCAVIPGAFDAWMLLLKDYGTMSLSEVLQPAIEYARNGYPIVPKITETIETVRELFSTEWTESAKLYLPNGQPPRPGSIFKNTTLADTYERIVAEAEKTSSNRERQIEAARDIWYRGWVAETIDKFCRDEAVMDVSGRKHSGLLTAEDMASWTSTYDEVASYNYGEYTVCKCGPWSQGPVLLQQLAILDGMDIQSMDPLGADFVHSVIEAVKLSFADREAYYGDPGFVDVPLEILLSKNYNESRRNLITSEASADLIPGLIAGYSNAIDHALVDRGEFVSNIGMGVGEPTVAKTGATNGDTVHLDIIDRHGNMISCTPSGGWLQSSPLIPELGFCLGNRGQMFWLDEHSPSTLVPGKLPRTTLSPSLALKNEKPYMVFGTPGGDQQDQWSTIMFLHHADHGMNLQEAIDAPSFHSEHFPGSFWPRSRQLKKVVLEDRFPQTTIDELIRRGHQIEVGASWSEGRLTGATIDNKILRAAANPRGMQGYAAGR